MAPDCANKQRLQVAAILFMINAAGRIFGRLLLVEKNALERHQDDSLDLRN